MLRRTVSSVAILFMTVGIGSASAAPSVDLPKTSAQGAARSGAVPPVVPAESSAIAFVKHAMSLATRGYAPEIPYQSGVGVVDTIHRLWGKPSSETVAGAGIYDTYSSRKAAFGFNKGMQLFDVRSYQSDVQSIRMSDVTAALGTNREVRYNGDETIWMYPAGPKYQLLWMFPRPTKASPNPKADHISVFYPEGTINSMAAEYPSPSVVLNEQPGALGELFTFSIKHRPPGYQLEEFEWLGRSGRNVVETFEQAVRNGAVGGTNAHFEVSGDGQTLSFIYGTGLTGQSGTLKLVFQNTSGAAAIATTPMLHLR